MTAISNSFGRDSSFSTEILEQINRGQRLWSELDLKSKEELIALLSPKVKILASRLKAKLPKNVEFEDLISAGALGLLESLAKFDPDLGVRLETYIEGRIKGAMLDELRKRDWVSRGFRHNIRVVEQAVRDWEQRFGTEPRIQDIEAQTGLSAKSIEQILEVIERQIWLSLDNLEPGSVPLDPDESGQPFANTLHKELIDRLSKHVEALTDREKLVLSLYYVEELTMREISEVLEITEGRVSQLHSQALSRLRRQMLKEYQEVNINERI